jgi:hypothetical protein
VLFGEVEVQADTRRASSVRSRTPYPVAPGQS